MPYYESVFIARQDVSAAQVDVIADQFSGLISEQGGRVTKREYWGLKNLTYRIKKNRKGHYVLFNIDAPSATVQELERNMRIHEDVLRYLTIRLDALDDAPSPMMQGRTRERAARERREREDRAAAAARVPKVKADVAPAAAAASESGSDAAAVTESGSDTAAAGSKETEKAAAGRNETAKEES